MAENDCDFKKQVGKVYQNGEGGYITLACQLDIPATSPVNPLGKTVEKIGRSVPNKRKEK